MGEEGHHRVVACLEGVGTTSLHQLPAAHDGRAVRRTTDRSFAPGGRTASNVRAFGGAEAKFFGSLSSSFFSWVRQ